MKQNLTVEHREHISARSFDEVASAFNAVTGTVEDGFEALVADAKTEDAFRSVVGTRVGESGFMRFLKVDHGAWLETFGRQSKAVMYVLGNPLIANTMLKHDLGAGLNVPVRLFIFESSDGATRVSYDLPSSLMSGIGSAAVDAAARKLDDKLVALAELISGVPA